MTMTQDEIFAKVRKVLEDALSVDEDEVTLDAKLEEDLGAESIDYLDIVFRLEKAFNIKIQQGEMLPETVLQDPEYINDGVVTDKGLAELRKRLPHVDLDGLESNPSVEELGQRFTVNTLVKFVQTKLA